MKKLLPAPKSSRVMYWTRLVREKSDEWLLVPGDNPTGIPVGVWKSFNKAFWEWKSNGLLFPLDELEAYQIAAKELCRIAENPPELERASPSTYLVAAAFKCLLKYKERQVNPARETYRTLFSRCRVAPSAEGEERGEDKGDREWTAANSTTLNAQAFVESLAGGHSADRVNAVRLAKVTVEETLAKLDANTRAGLNAFREAEGVWTDAAKIYGRGLSLMGYLYRFKHLWAPAFRKACTWIW